MKYTQSNLPVLAALTLLAAASTGPVAAQTIDQRQARIDYDVGMLALGGSSEQKLAQTFRVGVDGRLAAIDLPIHCDNLSSEVTISVRQQRLGRPDGSILRIARRNFPPADAAAFQRTYLPAPIPVHAGDQLAFTLSAEGPACGVLKSPVGNTYGRGDGFFDARPNPPGWTAKRGLDPDEDLPFKTIMESGSPSISDRCIVNTASGPNALPVSRYAPICRCLRDETLREFRCGLVSEDFFLWRHLPGPMVPGKPFEEIWQFLPASPLDGPVTLSLSGAGLVGTMTHVFGVKAKPGEPEEFIVQGIAPDNAKSLKGEALIEYPMINAVDKSQTRLIMNRSLGFGKNQK